MRHIIALFCLLAFSVPYSTAHASLLDIQEITSKSGVKAWLVEDHSVPVIALQFSFKGMGAAQDSSDKQGLSRMASNTMDEGAGDLDSQAFQKELQDKVIALRFTSSRDNFGGTLKTLSKNKARAFALLKLAITEPRFDQEAVDRMRKANQSRIRSAQSNPEWMAARILNDKAFEGHPYAQNSGGTLSSLETITPDDLRSFATKLSRDQLRVAVTGDITAEELKLVLDELFKSLPAKGNVEPPANLSLQNQGKIFVHKQDIPQTIVEIMQPGIDRNDPDFQNAQIMNFILGSSGFGSRLTKEIREKRGLTYGIYSYFTDMDHTDTLSVSTSTKNESVGEMLSLIKAEFETLVKKSITPKELEDAKAYLIGSLPLSLTSSDKIASLLLSLQLSDLPVNYLDMREQKLNAASIDDVQRVATRLLDPKIFTTILVGQPGEIEGAKIIEALPNVE